MIHYFTFPLTFLILYILFILWTTLLQHCKGIVIYIDFSHFIIGAYCVKNQIEGDKENEKVFINYYTMFIIF